MTTSGNEALTQGAHHIGLTVPNLEQTQAFFVDTLGYEKLGEVPDYPAVFLSDGTTMLTLWQVTNPDTATAFDRRNVIGLHHFAMKVANDEALSTVHEKLREHPDVQIEFAPEALGGGPARHLMCYIPGGIRVEFISTGG